MAGPSLRCTPHPRCLLTLVLVLAWWEPLLGRPSLDDIHSHERHGYSVRALAEKMSNEGSTGLGELTDDDVAVLFLRYQHEFNRTIESGAYTVPTLTPAFAAFADAARRYAAFAAAGDGERAGVALALNELADISEGDWDALASAGRRRLAMPFAQQHRRATGAIPAGRLDWREKGYAPAEVPSLAWGRYAAAAGGRGVAGVIDLSGPAGAVPLSGTAAAKAACLDALYQRAAGPRARLPRGGFAHLAASDARLRDALEAERRPAPPGATAGAFVTGPLGYGARHSPAARRARRFVPSPGFFGPAGERDRSEARAAGAGADTGAAAEEVEAAEETERAGAALAWLEGAGVEFVAVPFGDEVALHAALASHGPLVVALDASDAILQFYRGGVYAPRAADRACAPRSPTHAFLLLGYDDAAEAPPPPGDAATAAAHWILQSFWGRSWGADGVLRLKKGSNVCGVATNAVYARLAGGAAGAAAPAALE